LKKIAQLSWGQAIRVNDEQQEKDSKYFLKLYKNEWSNKVSSFAIKDMFDAKLNRKATAIKTEDVVKMSICLKNDISDLIVLLRTEPTIANGRKLAQVVMAYLIVFNRKRGGELSLTKTINFTDAIANQEDILQQTILPSLSAWEVQLAQSHFLMKIVAKRGHHVGVLIPAFVKPALDLLLRHRQAIGILPENPFLFAIPNSNYGHVSQWATLQKYAEAYHLSQPKGFTSTKLRHHLATTIQIMNLKEHELEWVAKFMVSIY
jgi:hypothetical protein